MHRCYRPACGVHFSGCFAFASAFVFVYATHIVIAVIVFIVVVIVCGLVCRLAAENSYLFVCFFLMAFGLGFGCFVAF